MSENKSVQIENRKARFEYKIERKLVAGIVLKGTEAKNIRDGKASLVDSYCYLSGGEIFLKGFHVDPTDNAFSHDPKREKKLLLKRSELNKLERELVKGTTLVVLRIFSNEKNLFKAEIGVATGKKQFDKRETIKQRDLERESRRN